MAFYTEISAEQLTQALAGWGLPAAESVKGAADGIENSTYFVEAGGQRYVLTIFEQITAEQLPFYSDLLLWLAARELPVACPVVGSAGAIQIIAGKPALLFPRLRGVHPQQPSAAQIREIGEFLGKMHAHTQAYPQELANPRGQDWYLATAQALQPQVNCELNEFLDLVCDQFADLSAFDLPRGLIHGDLFRDNALFEGDKLSGVIDFFSAGTDLLVLDVAVVANDWCGLPQGGVDRALVSELLAGYQRFRPLTAMEQATWSQALFVAAGRFWLSRLNDELRPSHGVVHAHKPSSQYLDHLRAHLRAL